MDQTLTSSDKHLMLEIGEWWFGPNPPTNTVSSPVVSPLQASQPSLRIVIPSAKPRSFVDLLTPLLFFNTPTEETIANDWRSSESCPTSAGSDSTLFSNSEFPPLPPEIKSMLSLKTLDDATPSFLDRNFEFDKTSSSGVMQPVRAGGSVALPSSPVEKRDLSSSLYKGIDISGCQITKKPCVYKRRGSVTIYTCSFEGCTRSFDRSFNLRAHFSTHLRMKPFKCAGCDTEFTRRFDVKRHQSASLECCGFEILVADA
ncbi:hypothetical protein HDU98_001068 [Podochytrium sp. JEL0797]|nr:hypothetical protein HDU98_001068 [Podochytrium sp. JEL0797]